MYTGPVDYDVFISYSTRDKQQANALHQALLSASLTAFIATEELQGGAGWAGELIEAIRHSRSVVLLFSTNSNDSPQVLREVQAAVKYRVPIIPVRIDATEPTRDMEYFLGTTHWHDASAPPFEERLPALIARTQAVIHGERNVWRLVQRHGGSKPVWAAGLAALVLGLFALSRSPVSGVGPQGSIPDPLGDLKGTWKLKSGPQAPTGDCYIRFGSYAWSGHGQCPASWRGGGNLQGGAGALDGAMGGDKSDDGWFSMQRGSNQNITGTWDRGWFGKLTLHEGNGGSWSFSKTDDDAVPDISTEILPRSGHAWPLADLPAIAQRALTVARREWQADATLSGITMHAGGLGGGISTSAGDYSIVFDLVSAAARKRVRITPYFEFGVLGQDSRLERGESIEPLPAQFLDLPAALRVAGENGLVNEDLADLELRNWVGTTIGSVRLNGLFWFIRPQHGDQYRIPAQVR